MSDASRTPMPKHAVDPLVPAHAVEPADDMRANAYEPAEQDAPRAPEAAGPWDNDAPQPEAPEADPWDAADAQPAGDDPMSAAEDAEPAAAPAQPAGADAEDTEAGARAEVPFAFSDEAIGEVEAPSQEDLDRPMPPLDDIPDDAGMPYDQAGLVGEAPLLSPDAEGLDHLEQAAVAAAASPSQTLPFAPVKPTSRTSPSASGRISGAAQATGALAWGSRTDVGRVREHNEDSYLIDFPLFAVADGMGGHAAGEVASTIAVSTLAQCQLTKPDPVALAAALEQANHAVLDGVAQGLGRPGMGTTCTAVVLDGNKMAVGHVGDSRAYLLHGGKLLRVTHDHSFVEELVEAGEITPEEARVHPSRSIITRALGSDPNMRADAFALDVTRGDRVLLCSDGLSSMIPDDVIEEAMVTSPAPQACADRLVDLALAAGGMDNVTVIVVDVKDDGIERHALRTRVRNVALWAFAVLVVLAAICGGVAVYAHNTYFLADKDGYVALYRGIPGSIGPLSLNEQIGGATEIQVSQLSETVEERLRRGITFGTEDDARLVLEQYRQQIAAGRTTSVAVVSSTDGMAAASSAGEAAGASSVTEGA